MSKSPIRYPNDEFERLWVEGEINDTDYRNTIDFTTSIEEFQISSAVLETTFVSRNNSMGKIRWNSSVPKSGEYYFVMCFTKAEELEVNAIWEFDISINGYSWSTATLEIYLDAIFLRYEPIKADSLENVNFSLDPTNRSSTGVIINALAIY